MDRGDDRDGVVEGHFRSGEDVGDGDVGRGLRGADRDRDHGRSRLPAGGLGRAADRIERINADRRAAVGDEDDPAENAIGGVVEGHRDPLPERRVGATSRAVIGRRIAAARFGSVGRRGVAPDGAAGHGIAAEFERTADLTEDTLRLRGKQLLGELAAREAADRFHEGCGSLLPISLAAKADGAGDRADSGGGQSSHRQIHAVGFIDNHRHNRLLHDPLIEPEERPGEHEDEQPEDPNPTDVKRPPQVRREPGEPLLVTAGDPPPQRDEEQKPPPPHPGTGPVPLDGIDAGGQFVADSGGPRQAGKEVVHWGMSRPR